MAATQKGSGARSAAPRCFSAEQLSVSGLFNTRLQMFRMKDAEEDEDPEGEVKHEQVFSRGEVIADNLLYPVYPVEQCVLVHAQGVRCALGIGRMQKICVKSGGQVAVFLLVVGDEIQQVRVTVILEALTACS